MIKKYVPYLVDSLEKELEKTSSETPFASLEKLYPRPNISIIDKPNLISHTPSPDEVILKSSIMYHYQCTDKMAEDILKEIEITEPKFRENLMDTILHKEERRELEQVQFTFQIPISLSILTHLTRHRMHSLLIPEFLPMWDLHNFITPATISANEFCIKLYHEAIEENIKVFEEFKKSEIMEEDLIYFYLGCQMLNVMTTINGRTAQWICRLRCCNKAQWQIRNIAKEMAKQIKEVSPLFGKGLGATCVTDFICNEGKESCGLIQSLLEENKEK